MEKKMREFFLSLWDKNEVNDYVICFETGRKLHRDIYRTNSCCYSHILEKENYPEFKYEEWNVRIVHPEAHENYTNRNDKKAPKQIKLREELLKKYVYDRSIQDRKVEEK